jgi:hypothetical protein
MKIENENILADALANGINLFLGAGFSTNAYLERLDLALSGATLYNYCISSVPNLVWLQVL